MWPLSDTFCNTVTWLQWHCTIMLLFLPTWPLLGTLLPATNQKQRGRYTERRPCFSFPLRSHACRPHVLRRFHLRSHLRPGVHRWPHWSPTSRLTQTLSCRVSRTELLTFLRKLPFLYLLLLIFCHTVKFSLSLLSLSILKRNQLSRSSDSTFAVSFDHIILLPDTSAVTRISSSLSSASPGTSPHVTLLPYSTCPMMSITFYLVPRFLHFNIGIEVTV